MKTSTPCLSLLGVLTLLCGNLFSQAASITVQVRDPAGLPVSGATVSLALASGQQTAAGHTRAAGSTTFNVPGGSYLVSVTAPGFAPHQRELALPAGETAELTIELQLGSVATEISVRASGGKGSDYRAGAPSGAGPTIPGRFGEYQVGGKLRLNLTSNQELTLGSGLDTQQDLDYPGRLLDANHFITRSWNGAYTLKEPASAIQSAAFRLYLSK